MPLFVVATTVLPAEPPRSKGSVLVSPALRATLMVRGFFGLLRLPASLSTSTSSLHLVMDASVENFLPCSVKSISVMGMGARQRQIRKAGPSLVGYGRNIYRDPRSGPNILGSVEGK